MAMNDFRAICLPYCLKKQNDGTYLVLNREYKPLSFKTREDNYLNQELPIYLKIKNLTSKTIEKILNIGEGATLQNEGKDLFLYNDKTIPTQKEWSENYFKRLGILMKLKID